MAPSFISVDMVAWLEVRRRLVHPGTRAEALHMEMFASEKHSKEQCHSIWLHWATIRTALQMALIA